MEDTKKVKAIALYSGGLDSTLAVLQMIKHGVEVEALTFLTHFGCDATDSSSCGSNPYPAAEKFGFRVKLSHLGQKFVDIVKNPKFGRGRNMNPCIDCRLLMISEAKNYMDMIGGFRMDHRNHHPLQKTQGDETLFIVIKPIVFISKGIPLKN